ncbi:hypothetical protein BKA70DRAFT_1555335 [Coprinopsis sp. MPI-PUGE-AT-0042]|nr:hypothetical protein BKA70DRAFT_1555335 [Coprinopsis sp. MPI-PUGE-AT-0042]
MAKTKDIPAAGPSSLSPCPAPSPPSRPARRRRKQPARQISRPLAPSSAVLSFLATVASVAEGSPAPPAFLCPSIESTAPPPAQTKAKRAPTPPSTPTTDPSPTTRLQHSRAVFSNIPYKFSQGDDGVWRKEEEYHLYGVCAGCDSVLDGQISKANTSMPSNNLNAEIEGNLPPGWDPPVRKNAHTMLILAISLVLAFFISFLIIGCLFWRKNTRWKNKDRDVEKSRRRRRRRNNSTDLTAEAIREIQNDKEAKVKQRLWARATERWRANARHSARQRRGKRIASSLRARQSNPSITYVDDDCSSRSPSPPATPTLSRSRRSSTSSFHQEPVSDPPSPAPVDNAPIPSIAISNPQPTSSPPAYQQKSNGSQAESSEGLYPPLSRRPSSASLLRHPSHSSPCLSSFEETPSTPGLAVAHVATDDKNVLARLAELASAPPAAHETTSEPEVSVPEWQDEQMEDFIAQQQQEQQQCVSENSPSCSIPSSPFPAPPTKGNLLSPDFYDYPFSFEDMTGSEPVYGPCAPPFEETPSAPLVDEETMELVPSAPPLIDDEDFYAPEQIPSAPPPEGDTSTTTTESCTDGVSVPSTPQEGHDADSSAAVPSTGGEEARGVLPVYRP